MKAKDLIKILSKNPEAEIRVTTDPLGQWDDPIVDALPQKKGRASHRLRTKNADTILLFTR